MSEIFEIDPWLEGDDSVKLRKWHKQAITDIITWFSISPGSLNGSINAGVDPRDYAELEDMNVDQLIKFDGAYKATAIDVVSRLSEKFEREISAAIEDGFSDVEFSVIDYRLGMAIIDIRAIASFDSDSRPIF